MLSHIGGREALILLFRELEVLQRLRRAASALAQVAQDMRELGARLRGQP